MRVEVTVREGKKFNRTEGGELKTYVHGKRFSVSQRVYEAFKDQLVLMGKEPPKPAAAAAQGGQTPGTDDEPPLVTQLVNGLAAVGLTVDPAMVATWKTEQVEKIPGLIGRRGKNPPKFVTEALLAPPC
jgi:hypothetical protein